MVLRGVGSVSSVAGIAAPVCEGDFAAEPPILPAGSGWRMSAQSGLSLISLDGAPLIPSVSNGFRVKLGLKRMLDIGLSVSALLLLAPFFLLIMMRIKTESAGPTLFRQWREGLRGRPIEVIKFRSIYACFADHSGREQVTADDIRVTPLGRMLRRRSIDELPQLFCVLRGEMSLVGPRPHAFGMLAGGVQYDQLVPYYRTRHLVMKPGITGWAQVNGLRGRTDDARLARMRIDHDLAYVQNFSLWLDLVIIFRTLRQEIMSGSGT